MSEIPVSRSTTPVVLAHPFRIFFISCGIYAIFVVLAWIAFLFAGWPLPIGWSPLQWHSHEMLYGFVSAAVAGFVLTAMTNWTGARPLQGVGLLALVLLWLAGRGVMWFAGWLPAWLVAAVDLAFLPVLVLYIARVLIGHSNRRNLILVAVLALMFVGNLLMQIGFATGKTGLLKEGELLGFNLITVLIVIIAGRIIPAFTGNWLRMQGGDAAWVRKWSVVETLSLASVVLLMIADLLPLPGAVVGGLALLAAVVNAVRLAGWAGWRTLKEPLLWILHLGYLWIVFGLFLRGSSVFFDGISPSLWQHMLGLGGFATLILGVMTRVAVGHTGRPLKLIRFGIWIYVTITIATVMRLLAAAGIADYRFAVTFSALTWVLAFVLFVALYAPLLSSPRADGRPD